MKYLLACRRLTGYFFYVREPLHAIWNDLYLYFTCSRLTGYFFYVREPLHDETQIFEIMIKINTKKRIAWNRTNDFAFVYG